MQRKLGTNVEDAKLESTGVGWCTGHWIKNLSNLHQRILGQMNSILMGEESLPE